jgi:hypothetical protein
VEWIFSVAISIILIMVVGLARIMREEEEDRAYIRPVSKLLLAIRPATGCLAFPGPGRRRFAHPRHHRCPELGPVQVHDHARQGSGCHPRIRPQSAT